MSFGWSVEEMTAVPASRWRPPDLSALPDRLHGVVGFDCETHDCGLEAKQGAGWAWAQGGRVVGYSVCADNFTGYLPIRHTGGGNVEVEPVLKWLRHVLSDPDQLKVGANVMYDLGWAARDGIEVAGRIVDVQWVEALLNEYRLSYSLDAIAREHLGRGKDEALLEQALRAYGGKGKGHIHILPGHYVGPYAEEDAALPREIWARQRELIEARGLWAILRLELDLLPMYLDMRRRGIRIDAAYAERLRGELKARSEAMALHLLRTYDYAGTAWTKAKITRVLAADGVDVPASLRSEFLKGCAHPFAQAIFEWRQTEKLRTTFVEGQILRNLRFNRVHGEIHPLKADEGGTVSGRLSMSNPNLQNIPVRTEVGKLIRGLFLPENGEQWGSCDYSQQETRLMVHFAVLENCPGAHHAQQQYHTDPDLNYHKFTAELTGLPYKDAKNLNFAILYGRGIASTARLLDISEDETKQMFAVHAAKMPFARALSRNCMQRVERSGYLRTLGGRHCRFPHWEPRRWDRRTAGLHDLAAAQRRWPREVLTRARIHKALNSLIQPSAADQMKHAMREIWRAGLGSRVLLQVHDELGLSVPDRATAETVAQIMVEAVPLEVPSVVDVGIGSSWKDAD